MQVKALVMRAIKGALKLHKAQAEAAAARKQSLDANCGLTIARELFHAWTSATGYSKVGSI